MPKQVFECFDVVYIFVIRETGKIVTAYELSELFDAYS